MSFSKRITRQSKSNLIIWWFSLSTYLSKYFSPVFYINQIFLSQIVIITSGYPMYFTDTVSITKREHVPLCEKFPKYGVFSGPYFPVFGLITEIYGVILRIQSKYGKIRTRKNSVFGHFSRNVSTRLLID